MFTLRFDLRAPAEGAHIRDLYSAALEMARWGERHGCLMVFLSEHHASPDGYLPAPLVLASAMAACTKTLPIQVAALLVPLHDPIELAEQMAVLDIVSGGRVSYVTAIGYRAEEYAMFGRDMKQRGRRMEACLDALKKAWTGEPFEFEGRPARVTPTPLTPGGPSLLMGGNSEPAARRAARFGMGLLAEGGNPEIETIYREECEKQGVPPGMCIVPAAGTVTSAFVAEDPDRAWAEIGPHLLRDARTYAGWMSDGHETVSKSAAASVEELRAENGAYQIFTPEDAVAYVRTTGVLLLQPLCGGLPPEKAWPSLELVASKVLPALRGA